MEGSGSEVDDTEYEASSEGIYEAIDDEDLEQVGCVYENIPVLPKAPIIDGDVTTIEVQRGCYDFGMAIAGGIDTPLMCVVVQEILPDGVAEKDGRLKPGDQLLEVNGEDLTQATHEQAVDALSRMYPICRITVYREKAEESHPIEKEEILKIGLNKVTGRQLGIKLVGKKTAPGVFILSLIPGSLAHQDGRLMKDDRILEINGHDLTFGTQEEAADIIQASPDRVQFVLCRKSRPQTPDIIRSASHEAINEAAIIGTPNNRTFPTLKPPRDRVITISKNPQESLGMCVAGGVGNQRGDVPIYVSNIQPNGCIGRSKQIKKGDILLSINGTNLVGMDHSEAVKVLKGGAEAKAVTLKIIEGPITSDGLANFAPSWMYWLSLPKCCQVAKTIPLQRSHNGSLGFSIVGGNDTGLKNHAIHIKTIVPNSPAYKDGRLRCGDVILSVNNYSLADIAHGHAVSLLKHMKGTIALTIVSWPGTVV